MNEGKSFETEGGRFRSRRNARRASNNDKWISSQIGLYKGLIDSIWLMIPTVFVFQCPMETTTCSTPALCCETQRVVVTDASIIGLTPDPLWNVRNEVIDYLWKNDAQPWNSWIIRSSSRS